jgi:hypothetical protein
LGSVGVGNGGAGVGGRVLEACCISGSGSCDCGFICRFTRLLW